MKVLVLPDNEATALLDVVVALDQWLAADAPLRLAGDKLDEQIAQQMRDPYEVAEDELRELLAYTLDQWQHDQIYFDVLARAVVDRVLGIYETSGPKNQERSS